MSHTRSSLEGTFLPATTRAGSAAALETASGSFGSRFPRPATGDASCARCPAGAFCPEASTLPTLCPAGHFGNSTGLETSECDGVCARGHFCPPGTARETQFPCPAGSYGNATQLTSSACSTSCTPYGASLTACDVALCEPGYYCEPGSTSARSRECGEGFFCPRGSAEPTPLAPGQVGVGGTSPQTRTAQATCNTCCPDGATLCDNI